MERSIERLNLITPFDGTDISHLKELSRWMDDAFEIPVIKRRIGLDGMIGLIPGFGDIFTAIISIYIVLEAMRLEVSKAVLSRMIINILIDVAFGVIPILGDLGDLAWKANRKNVQLLERHLASPRETQQRSLVFIVSVGVGLIGLVSLAAISAILIFRFLVQIIAFAL